MRTTLENNDIFDPIIRRGWKLQKMVWVPADNAVLDPDASPYIELNPAGIIDILMPTSSPALAGLTFLLSNISANLITLKTDGDAAFTTALSLATMVSKFVVCTGSATQALGWRST